MVSNVHVYVIESIQNLNFRLDNQTKLFIKLFDLFRVSFTTLFQFLSALITLIKDMRTRYVNF